MAWWNLGGLFGGSDRARVSRPSQDVAVAPRREWAGLTPLQRTFDRPVATIATTGFTSQLSAHRAPQFLAPLAHDLRPEAPTGVVRGLSNVAPPEPVQLEASQTRSTATPPSRMPERRLFAQLPTVGGWTGGAVESPVHESPSASPESPTTSVPSSGDVGGGAEAPPVTAQRSIEAGAPAPPIDPAPPTRSLAFDDPAGLPVLPAESLPDGPRVVAGTSAIDAGVIPASTQPNARVSSPTTSAASTSASPATSVPVSPDAGSGSDTASIVAQRSIGTGSPSADAPTPTMSTPSVDRVPSTRSLVFADPAGLPVLALEPLPGGPRVMPGASVIDAGVVAKPTHPAMPTVEPASPTSAPLLGAAPHPVTAAADESSTPAIQPVTAQRQVNATDGPFAAADVSPTGNVFASGVEADDDAASDLGVVGDGSDLVGAAPAAGGGSVAAPLLGDSPLLPGDLLAGDPTGPRSVQRAPDPGLPVPRRAGLGAPIQAGSGSGPSATPFAMLIQRDPATPRATPAVASTARPPTTDPAPVVRGRPEASPGPEQSPSWFGVDRSLEGIDGDVSSVPILAQRAPLLDFPDLSATESAPDAGAGFPGAGSAGPGAWSGPGGHASAPSAMSSVRPAGEPVPATVPWRWLSDVSPRPAAATSSVSTAPTAPTVSRMVGTGARSAPGSTATSGPSSASTAARGWSAITWTGAPVLAEPTASPTVALGGGHPSTGPPALDGPSSPGAIVQRDGSSGATTTFGSSIASPVGGTTVVSSSVPVVQRQDPPSASIVAAEAPADAPGSAMSDDQVEQLARRIYPRLRDRWRNELRLDRERAGRFGDVRF